MWASLVTRTCQPVQKMQVQSLGWEDPLEKEMTTHFSILAQEIQWMEEPSGLHSPWGCKKLDMTERLNNNKGVM